MMIAHHTPASQINLLKGQRYAGQRLYGQILFDIYYGVLSYTDLILLKAITNVKISP